ncbi:BBE domain-containing protein [Rahnella aquatilis]|uniref:BBE domain-containing protein n=1 Tax=Rahnella aquatilis TaxID=34038 RepID=UPI000645EA39|nr:BBE domain-containing protein [Rahnella aquatilis]
MNDVHIRWMQDFYHAYFSDYGGKPVLGAEYEGCYINYPDIDMKYTDGSRSIVDPDWLSLYYEDKTMQLITTKNSIDPHNFFCHELSIPLVKP